MKCLLKYRWVKLPRAQLPQGKGVLGYWSRLAARAAFRKGTACYCGYHNEVVPGMWSGGIVGLKKHPRSSPTCSGASDYGSATIARLYKV